MKIPMTEFWFRQALMEAAQWDQQATQEEKTSMSFAEARKQVLSRIFKKYKEKGEKSETRKKGSGGDRKSNK